MSLHRTFGTNRDTRQRGATLVQEYLDQIGNHHIKLQWTFPIESNYLADYIERTIDNTHHDFDNLIAHLRRIPDGSFASIIALPEAICLKNGSFLGTRLRNIYNKRPKFRVPYPNKSLVSGYQQHHPILLLITIENSVPARDANKFLNAWRWQIIRDYRTQLNRHRTNLINCPADELYIPDLSTPYPQRIRNPNTSVPPIPSIPPVSQIPQIPQIPPIPPIPVHTASTPIESQPVQIGQTSQTSQTSPNQMNSLISGIFRNLGFNLPENQVSYGMQYAGPTGQVYSYTYPGFQGTVNSETTSTANPGATGATSSTSSTSSTSAVPSTESASQLREERDHLFELVQDLLKTGAQPSETMQQRLTEGFLRNILARMALNDENENQT